MPPAAKHTLSPRDIQLVTVGFSLEATILPLLTLKCSTKSVIHKNIIIAKRRKRNF